EPLQALESDVRGELFPAAGSCGGDTEESRRGAHARRAHRGQQNCPNGRACLSGARGGAVLPPRLLWLSAGAIGVGRGGNMSTAVLEKDWVIDLDLKAFFDSIPHDLLLKAVSKHADLAWVLLYVRRWLVAPLQREDGAIVERDRGTPQGSAISP